MTGPVVTGLLFSAIVISLSFLRPEKGRIFLGVFFILMGSAVNVFFIITQPYFVYQYGMGAWLPLYRRLTETVIGMNPILFGVLLILFEIAVGFMLLGKKGWVKGGLILSSLFMLGLIPLYYAQTAWALSVPAILFLLKRDFGRNVFEMIRDRRKGSKTP